MQGCRELDQQWDNLQVHTANSNQKAGQLVSVATDRAVAISCRMRDEDKSIPAPAGSIYYLEHSQELFQDSGEGTEKAKRWRQLGYSELIWISYKE